MADKDTERTSALSGMNAAQRAEQDETARPRPVLAREAGGLASWHWDVAADAVTGDACLGELFGVETSTPIPSQALFDRVHPDDLPRVRDDAARRLERDDEFEAEFRVRHDEDGWRWLGGRGRVTERDEAGRPLVMLGLHWDVGEQKAHEDKLDLLATEMDHRIKNAFAVMRALINLGRRTASDVDSFAADLSTQVQAMADAHAASARLTRDRIERRPSVPVGEVLRTALAPWLAGGGEADGRDRVEIDVPDALTVSTERVSALAMLTHELATNAAKHGALSGRPGRLVVRGERRAEGGVGLTWEEHLTGAPLAANEDLTASGSTSGFGSVLVQHCNSMLGGTVSRRLTPEGLRFALVIPPEAAGA